MPRATPAIRRLLLRVAAVIVIGAVAVLFAGALVGGWERVREYDIAVDWSWPVALVLFALAVASSGLLWGRVLSRVSPETAAPWWEALRSHLGGWVVRYIPGVGSLIYKIKWAEGHGCSRLDAFVAFSYENVFLQLASIVGGGAILVAVIGPDLVAGNLVVVILVGLLVVAMFIALSRPVMARVLSFLATRRFRERVDAVRLIPTGRSLVFVIEYLVPRIINGAGVILIAIALFGFRGADLLLVAAAYTVAGALGILAVFVPSGLGVREGSFVLLLTAGGIDPVDAVVLAVVARFVSTLADLLVASGYGVLTLAHRKALPA